MDLKTRPMISKRQCVKKMNRNGNNMTLSAHGITVGSTTFLNGQRLTIKSVDPTIHKNDDQKYIYVDTKENGVTAMPI